MKFELDKLIRDNIRMLTPYSSARNEFKGEASVFLDANENSYGSPLKENFNRYPDPLQSKLKNAIALIKHATSENIFIGNGSDEVIDLAYRIFCNPGKDNVIICPPTYGMYEVCANINDVGIRKVNLTNDFQLDVNGIISATDQNTKLLFLCSPNNPTGNIMIRQDVDLLVKSFPGIVIIDEAYINYSRQRTFIEDLPKYPNLIVMQTLSKAWGLASLRIGLAFASLPIVELLNKVKPPYNINKASQQLAIEALQNISQVNDWMKQTIEQRDIIRKELATFSFVKKIYKSDANFLLVKVNDANNLYSYLSTNKIIVRNRSKEAMCDNCLRITIGTPKENLQLLKLLRRYEQ
ncbi:MAG: histidinol-phosphate transaminase [Chitinophagaceae bacterium]|nr:histidinol-phosphate transaminase [Chitinophagaceae bacterium]